MQATKHQGAYTSVPQLQYNCVPKFAKSLVGTNTTANCPAPQDFANGSALMAYNSTTFYDDLTYAAAWMYKATGGQQCCPAVVLGVQPAGLVHSATVYCCPHCSVQAGLARCSQHHRLKQALASCTCSFAGWLLQAPPLASGVSQECWTFQAGLWSKELLHGSLTAALAPAGTSSYLNDAHAAEQVSAMVPVLHSHVGASMSHVALQATPATSMTPRPTTRPT